MEERGKLYKLREAIARSEALYKERHLNIYEDDNDSDEDNDEDQIYSYYFNEDQEDTDLDNVDNKKETKTDPVIYDIPDTSSHHASYVVDQLLYGRLSERVQMLPGGGVTILLSEQCSARL